MATIADIFSVVEAVLSGDFDAAWEAIKNILNTWGDFFKGIWEDVKAVFSDASSAGSKIVDDIIQGISDAWDGLVSWFSGLWDSLFGNLNANVDVSGTASGGVDGSHASGLDYVPFDGYVAELHRGEMVVPAEEAKMLRSGASGGVASSDVANILNLILDAIQEGNSQEKVFKVNNREFGRMIRGAVNA
jgi:hypothetical protein